MPNRDGRPGRVAVVGTGVVGSSWALVFARAGHEVTVFDPSAAALERARGFVEAAAVGGRVHYTTDLAAALRGAGYVQESVPERIDTKRAFYGAMEASLPPDAMVGSSTSGLPASSFTGDVAFRERCLVVHPINPPHLIPLVELVPAPWTTPGAVDAAARLMEEAGQVPVRLSREINGFLVNRLQGAILAEAFRLVEDGVCSTADIDRAVKDGLGLRWAFMGPFETIDLNAAEGVREYCRNLGPMYHGLAKEQADPRPWGEALVSRVEAELRAATPAAGLPARRGWRDRALAGLVAARRRVLAAAAEG